MKKLFAVLAAALFCTAGLAFAQTADVLGETKEDTRTMTIVPENQHVTNKSASVSIDYTPYTDEAIIYYKILSPSYDQGEAMNTCLECLRDFQEQNGYYKYTYLRKDKVHYIKDDKNMKWAIHQQWVKFIR